MKAFEDVSELLLVLFRDAFIEDCESCWSMRVLDHVNLKIQGIFHKIKVQADFFVIYQRSYLQCENFWLAFLRLEVISELSDDLIILFFVRVLNFVDELQIFLAFEVLLFIFKDFRFHLGCLAEIWEFLWEYFDELYLLLLVDLLGLFLLRT